MKRLVSTSYTDRARRTITTAAVVRFGRATAHLHYEHHQWWAILPSGKIYSVVDTIPGIETTGIDFEET